MKVDPNKVFDNNLLTFSYVGGFSPDRCLFKIVSIAEKGLINLSIAGFGNEELETRLKEDTEKYKTVNLFWSLFMIQILNNIYI